MHDALFCQTPQNADSLSVKISLFEFFASQGHPLSSEGLGPANKQLPVCHQIRRRLASILNANTGLLEGLHTAIDSTNERGSADRNSDLPVQFTNIGGSLVHQYRRLTRSPISEAHSFTDAGASWRVLSLFPVQFTDLGIHRNGYSKMT
jgi:hypothetical protein